MRLAATIAFLTGTLLLATGFRAGAETAPAGGPLAQPFQATYKFSRGHMWIARVVFTLKDEGGGTWRYRSVTKPAGLVALFRSDVIIETSRFRIHDDHLRPLRYSYLYQNGSEHSGQSVTFDWQTMVAHTVDKGKKRDVTLKPGMTDRFLAQLALSRDLAAGRDPTPAYSVVDRGELKRYLLNKAGAETVRTPAGKFKTVRVMKTDPDSKRVTTFWLAPQLSYLPARMEQSEPDEPTMSLELEDFKRLPPRAFTPPPKTSN